MATAPRIGWLAYRRQYRQRQIARGRCVYCSLKAHGGTTMCLAHRLYQAAWKTAKRKVA